MPWSMNKGAVGWWPTDIDPEQKEILSKISSCFFWPRLYVCGVAEDDEVILYLQSLGQPFQLFSLLEENTEERLALGIESDRPAFWYPGFTTNALVGLDDIRRQFEYEMGCQKSSTDQHRRHILWPKVNVALS